MTVGIVYTVLSALLYILAWVRQRHSRHDFADTAWTHPKFQNPVPTVGQTGKRVFGRPFITAGWVVVAVTVVVAAIEIALLVLIFEV